MRVRVLLSAHMSWTHDFATELEMETRRSWVKFVRTETQSGGTADSTDLSLDKVWGDPILRDHRRPEVILGDRDVLAVTTAGSVDEATKNAGQ